MRDSRCHVLNVSQTDSQRLLPQCRTWLNLRRLIVAAGLLATSAGIHAQQVLEPISDPNPLCLSSAQDVGPLTLPFSVDGALEANPQEARLDYYRFEAQAGTLIDIRMLGQSSGSGTLQDPFLGLFDEQCRLLVLNDDSGSLESYLRVAVPDSGTFTLAAAKYPDSEFNGGSGDSEGSYRLTIDGGPDLIDSISVRVVNQLTGEPIPGDRDPFAYVELYRCDLRDCVEFIDAFNANSDGRVSFNSVQFPNGLAAGTFLLRVHANDYGSNESGRFIVGVNDAFDVRDVALVPPPISIGGLTTCENIPPQGGICTYNVNVDNNTDNTLDALAWSLVDGYSLGLNYSTRFEASSAGPQSAAAQRAVLQIPAFSSLPVSFSFEVPSFTREGAQFCQSVYLGLAPSPLFNILKQDDLFCIEKVGNAFRFFDGVEMVKAGMARDERSIDQRMLSHGASVQD